MTDHIHHNSGVALSPCHFLHHEHPVGTKDRTYITNAPTYNQKKGIPSTDTFNWALAALYKSPVCVSQEKGGRMLSAPSGNAERQR
jgi:hypothetical protein